MTEPTPIHLHIDSFPLKEGPQPKVDIQLAIDTAALDLPVNLERAPDILEEWVGRESLLMEISQTLTSPKYLVMGLIGFGGEGKSSLARQWINFLLQIKEIQLDGILWWSFYEKDSVDEFLETALLYVSNNRINLSDFPSTNARVNFLSAMLRAGSYLFVLDGLEVMQHQIGDEYGLIKSKDLAEFINYFAAGEHESFCLITSRIPILDLVDYITYRHCDVERLSEFDGRNLLNKLGVKGNNEQLDLLVARWDGHALTLALLASYLVEQHGGDIASIENLPVPMVNEPRYERVSRVLRRYDNIFTQEERYSIQTLSTFRLPIPKAALKVLAIKESTIQHFESYRIIRLNSQENHYTIHPLIRSYYLSELSRSSSKKKEINRKVANYYTSIKINLSELSKLDELEPLIEAVYHFCQAEEYDEADCIRLEQIEQNERYFLTENLGADETVLSLLLDFFPNKNISEEPLVRTPSSKSGILNEVGLCLLKLGRLSFEVENLYKRSLEIDLNYRDFSNAIIKYENLAEFYIYQGQLRSSKKVISEALALSLRQRDLLGQRTSLMWQAWINHLLGQLDEASSLFTIAERIERQLNPDVNYLFRLRGIYHADHLRLTGDIEYAQRIAEANLDICERNHWVEYISLSHRVLGDIAREKHQLINAYQHYETSLKIARNISKQNVLIEALLAQGYWMIHQNEREAALSSLQEALVCAKSGGYRLYEADIIIAMAYLHLASKNSDFARRELLRARQMSLEMDYYWGQINSDKGFSALDNY